MILMFKDFYDVLVENLSSYQGVYASFIDYGPNLFRLLCDLFEEDVIDEESRLRLSAAISYYIIPMDIIPEAVHGPYGYIDDIFCVHVILLVKRGRQQCRHPHRFSACRQGASGIEVLSPCSRVRPFSSCAHILPCPAS